MEFLEKIFREAEAVELLLELGEAELGVLLFVVGVLEHDPPVDQVGGGEDVEERGRVRREPCQAGLGRLGAVGVALAHRVEVLPEAVEQLPGRLVVQLVQRRDE